MLAAATTLFCDNGFGATTVSAIAAEAGVSEPTVYYTFGTKEAVLMAALDVAIAGDDEPVSTLDRQWSREVIDASDPAEQVALMVQGAGRILLRAAGLLQVLQRSASMSPEMLGHWNENIARRRTVQHEFVKALAAKEGLAPALSVETATDVSALHLGPEVYSFLTAVMGWSHEQWLAWTVATLRAQLLDPGLARDGQVG